MPPGHGVPVLGQIEMRVARSEGATYEEIASDTGYSTRTVRKYVVDVPHPDGTFQARGERNAWSTLTEDEVRWLISDGALYGHTEAARILRCSESAVRKVRSGQTWAWLTGRRPR